MVAQICKLIKVTVKDQRWRDELDTQHKEWRELAQDRKSLEDSFAQQKDKKRVE